jgi:hypothetical protein
MKNKAKKVEVRKKIDADTATSAKRQGITAKGNPLKIGVARTGWHLRDPTPAREAVFLSFPLHVVQISEEPI